MGNDYLQKEDLADFHRRVAAEMQHVKRKKIGVGRGLTIKYVLDWMARRSEKTTEQIIKEVRLPFLLHSRFFFSFFLNEVLFEIAVLTPKIYLS